MWVTLSVGLEIWKRVRLGYYEYRVHVFFCFRCYFVGYMYNVNISAQNIQPLKAQ